MSNLVVVTAADLRRSNNTDPKRKSNTIQPGLSPSVVSRSQQIGLYNSRHHILIVGDGNLSFSLSLASFLVSF